ncbi:MAG TPA: hypothetical protein DCO75_12315 [Fibrobacteres bacterium]|nr:hypothetical protein [Fibrobacterota bacterium]
MTNFLGSNSSDPGADLFTNEGVGIKTTSLSEIDEATVSLDVQGYAGFRGLRVGLDGSNDILSESTNGLTLTASDGSGKIQLKTGGNSEDEIRMTVASSGNVGIGTTIPAQKLDVNGNIRLSDGSTSTDYLIIERSVSTATTTGYIKAKNNAGVIMYVPVFNTSTGIQACIDAAYRDGGGTVYLPAGSYTITAPVIVYQNVTLAGAGPEATILIDNMLGDETHTYYGVIQTDPATWTWKDPSDITKGGSWNVKFRICVKNLCVKSTSTQSFVHTGVFFRGTGESLIENVYVCGQSATNYLYRGIHVQGWVNNIKSCYVYQCPIGYDLSFDNILPSTTPGVWTDITTATYMTGCHFHAGDLEGEQIGCRISGGTNNTIIGCTFEKNFNIDRYQSIPRATIGIYIKGTLYGPYDDSSSCVLVHSHNTLISGVYMESLRTTVKLENCETTTIIGVNTMVLKTGATPEPYPSIEYVDDTSATNGINTALAEYCNSVQNIYQNIYRWDSTKDSWECPAGEYEIFGAPVFKGNLSVLNDIYMNIDQSLWIGSHSDSGKRLRLLLNGSGNSYIDYADGSLNLRAGTDIKFILTSEGKVGIGTTSPSRKFEVKDGQLGVLPASGYAGVISVLPSSNGSYWNIANTNNGEKLMIATGNKLDANDTTDWSSSEVTVTSEGKVGIGTTSPGYRLDIQQGDARILGSRYSSTGDPARLYLGDGNAGVAAMYGTGLRIGVYKSGGGGTLGSNSCDAMAIAETSGNVGIGQTNPTAKLDVNPGTISDSNPNIRLEGVTSTVPSGGNNGDIQIYESGTTRRLYVKINGTWRYSALT